MLFILLQISDFANFFPPKSLTFATVASGMNELISLRCTVVQLKEYSHIAQKKIF